MRDVRTSLLTFPQRIAAVVVACAIFTVGLMAASPELHRAVHADCDHSQHSCAVTLLEHSADAGPAAVVFVFVLWIQTEIDRTAVARRTGGGSGRFWVWAVGPPTPSATG